MTVPLITEGEFDSFALAERGNSETKGYGMTISVIVTPKKTAGPGRLTESGRGRLVTGEASDIS
jgi:hypothetical protein